MRKKLLILLVPFLVASACYCMSPVKVNLGDYLDATVKRESSETVRQAREDAALLQRARDLGEQGRQKTLQGQCPSSGSGSGSDSSAHIRGIKASVRAARAERARRQGGGTSAPVPTSREFAAAAPGRPSSAAPAPGPAAGSDDEVDVIDLQKEFAKAEVERRAAIREILGRLGAGESVLPETFAELDEEARREAIRILEKVQWERSGRLGRFRNWRGDSVPKEIIEERLMGVESTS